MNPTNDFSNNPLDRDLNNYNTPTNSPSVARVALKWGLITGVGSVIYALILHFAGQMGNQWLGYLGFAILIIGLVLAIQDYRQQNGGFMTFGQGLGVGALTSAVTGVISAIWQFIYGKLFPEATREVLQRQYDKAVDEGRMTVEQADQAIEMTNSMSGLLPVFAVIGTLFIGFIISLIISAILKKDRPNFG